MPWKISAKQVTKAYIDRLKKEFRRACNDELEAHDRVFNLAQQYAELMAPAKVGDIIICRGGYRNVGKRFKVTAVMPWGWGATPAFLGWSLEAVALKKDTNEACKNRLPELLHLSDKPRIERKLLPEPISLSTKAGREKLKNTIERTWDKT